VKKKAREGVKKPYGDSQSSKIDLSYVYNTEREKAHDTHEIKSLCFFGCSCRAENIDLMTSQKKEKANRKEEEKRKKRKRGRTWSMIDIGLSRNY
jgi:hypothetical protein